MGPRNPAKDVRRLLKTKLANDVQDWIKAKKFNVIEISNDADLKDIQKQLVKSQLGRL